MEHKATSKVGSLYSLGLAFLVVGAIAIFSNIVFNLIFILRHSIWDVVPANLIMDPDQLLIYTLLAVLGIPAMVLFVACAWGYNRNRGKEWGILAPFAFVLASLATNASLVFGGGWFLGTISSDIGFVMLLVFFVQRRRMPGIIAVPERTGIARNKARKGTMILAAVLAAGVAASAVVPFAFSVLTIPQPLIQASATVPPGVTPDHQNTFYILPIWEENPWNYTVAVGKINYLKEAIGGETYTGDGFVKIGWSMSCWYTNNINPDGSFNPEAILRALNLSASTNTPILFHMNGGNWGQHWSDNDVIEAMRENVSNTQWDQRNTSHPSMQRPGPNDRFWSFWPGSDWEQFRERNIKQALAYIYNWSVANPGLLVGFSTDSEIHLNNHDFHDTNPGGYRSYFDYNPGTIQQYKYWAQNVKNWSREQFNQMCGTSFATWDDVDAPRAEGIVGVAGNPWWETWTDFRTWHVKEAGARQGRWINESGFPREMIWHHQILSEPGDRNAKYQRCDVLETAVNEYCKVGVTRYDWISPASWHSLGELALNDGSGDTIPSWGIFEWNLWTQHQYWAYREMLNCIYQYGGHVICPNEWTNCSRNEGLWIPGDPPVLDEGVPVNASEYDLEDLCPIGECTGWDENGTCNAWVTRHYLRHGNAQFLAALKDFVSIGQTYPRGTCPALRVSPLDLIFYNQYDATYETFSNDEGLISMGVAWLLCVVLMFIAVGSAGNKRKAPAA